MEFIQKKTMDRAVEYFLPKASEMEISLIWDRFEGQLPECGFCETGLSCRDCLQGPCISHPFRDSNKAGICGKERETLAIQSLLRLVLKGTMVYLDRLSEFAKEMESKQWRPKNKSRTDQILKTIQSFFYDGGMVKKELPKIWIRPWEEAKIFPQGMVRDLFRASQKLEGGFAENEEILLWIFKSSLLALISQRLYGELKRSSMGNTTPTWIEVNLGVLDDRKPNLLLYGYLSPVFKQKVAQEAQKESIQVLCVGTYPLIPSFSFPAVTNYGSQEIPLMTGAIDLIVASDQGVNPSIKEIAKTYEVPIFSIDDLKRDKGLSHLAKEIIGEVKKSHEFRKRFPRDIPSIKESAVIGFSKDRILWKKILKALDQGQIRGVAFLFGSGNVKFSQDHEITTFAKEFLKNDILCLSKGESSIALAKYGFLNPKSREDFCGKGVLEFLKGMGEEVPSVIDMDECEFIDFILEKPKEEKKAFPMVACFPEAHRSWEVVEAVGMVTLGITTYFWPALPITGSQKAMEALTAFGQKKLGSSFYIPMEKKMEARSKATMILKTLTGQEGYGISGKPWR